MYDFVSLHQRLLHGDPHAADQLCTALCPILRGRLTHWHATVDEHAVESAVHDALLVYLKAPARFKPTSGALENWLTIIATNRLRDECRRSRRRGSHEVSVAVLPEVATALSVTVQLGHPTRPHKAIFRLAATSHEERAFLIAKLRGIRNTSILAGCLGLSDLAVREQRGAVKRTWDRLHKRLRAAAKLGLLFALQECERIYDISPFT